MHINKIIFEMDCVLANLNTCSMFFNGVKYSDLSLNNGALLWVEVVNNPSNLTVNQQGLAVFNQLKQTYNVEILTSIPQGLVDMSVVNSIKAFKRQWIIDNVDSSVIVRFYPSSQTKSAWIAPDVVLIDNNSFIVRDWRYKGGIAIKHTNPIALTDFADSPPSNGGDPIIGTPIVNLTGDTGTASVTLNRFNQIIS